MTALRKIQPIAIPAGLLPSKDLGRRPELKWVAPASLLVDGTYQRDLSRQSIKLIHGMVKRFAWNRMKPPIVVETAEGLHVIDGQHTAIAAVTLGIPEIPIFVVEAEKVSERARAFVGHNTDRITVSPLGIYHALLAAGDETALDVGNVCRRAGVRIRYINQAATTVEVGDTMAIGLIQKLVARQGVIKARRVLDVLVRAKCAPIGGGHIRAAEHLLCEVKDAPAADELAAIIRLDGIKGFNAAHARARAERMPFWRALADRWSRRIRAAA